MQIKRFEAPNMTEALKRIKGEFGPDAVILSARTLKPPRGMLRGWRSRPAVEVTAAIDHPAAGSPYQAKLHTAGGVYRRQPQVGRPAAPRSTSAGRNSRRKITFRPAGSVKKGKARAAKAIQPDSRPLFELHRQLIRQGVRETLAWNLVKEMAAGADDAETGTLPSRLAEALRALGGESRRLKLSPGGTNLVALVGPSGVGKTTTLVKLAAAALTHGAGGGVAIISIDQHRIGAQEQLRTYAGIIGIPMATAVDGDDLEALLADFSGYNLILLDTPGINPLKEADVDELAGFFENCRPSVQVVLSATAKSQDLEDTIYHLRPLRPQGLIFTKLDETATYGSLLSAMLYAHLPVAYLTSGREVPEDFEPATLERLAELLAPAGESPAAAQVGRDQFAAELKAFEKRLNQTALAAPTEGSPPVYRAGAGR